MKKKNKTSLLALIVILLRFYLFLFSLLFCIPFHLTLFHYCISKFCSDKSSSEIQLRIFENGNRFLVDIPCRCTVLFSLYFTLCFRLFDLTTIDWLGSKWVAQKIFWGLLCSKFCKISDSCKNQNAVNFIQVLHNLRGFDIKTL